MASRQPGPEYRPSPGPPGLPSTPLSEVMARLALEALLGLHRSLAGRLATAINPLSPEVLAHWSRELGDGLRLSTAADWLDLAEILFFHENLWLTSPPEELPFWLLEGLYGLRDDLKEAGLWIEPLGHVGDF